MSDTVMGQPRVYCEMCKTADIPQTSGRQVAPGVWIEGDTTANDHLRLWHPNEWFEMDTSGLPDLIVLRSAPDFTPHNHDLSAQ